MLEFSGERYIPDLKEAQISYEHWHRYLYASYFVKDKVVLDIACGEGYGSDFLSNYAKKVIGVDIDENSINHAKSKYKKENLEFILGSFNRIPIEEEEVFDAVISFETINRIPENLQETFLIEIKRLLKKDGLFIVSIPNKLFFDDFSNFVRLYIEDYKQILSKFFKKIKLVGQKVYSVSCIRSIDEDLESELEELYVKRIRGQFELSQKPKAFPYVVAICSDFDIKNIKSSILFNVSDDILEFQEVENPKVSIIIPVHNKFDYTYRLLRTIHKHTNLSDIEIIIADDGSTDETLNIHKYVKGIKVVRNEKPLGFLKNCNKASRYAKGKYILFLNNDTLVQPKWLDYLLETIEKDKSIGMVGPKFLFPNGLLQEAGGIVWNDGSAWNYGRNSNPESPECNYLKEVDYITGACILINKKLWEDIGGFDERYVPAYYEDTDIAFEIRKMGYKVVYQPKSVVIHYEGISHGKDPTKGIKNYMEINREKFVEKWAEVLKKDHFPPGENVFLARDKSAGRKRILVIDCCVPIYDISAGTRAVYTWLKVFKDLGLKITFIGDDFYNYEPYTSELQQMGIEVLYGLYYARYWKNWMYQNLKYFDYIFLNRADVSKDYIDNILDIKAKQKLENLKIIYCPQDLAFLRLKREAHTLRLKSLLEESEKLKKLEYEIINKSDIIIAVGSFEKEYIKKRFPNKDIRSTLVFAYNSDDIPLTKRSFDNRFGLFFIGGFRHRPNYYGIKWFLESGIWDKIKENIPDVKLYIAGSLIPADILSLPETDNQIEVLGRISDSTLIQIYDKIRISVVPLTYGAGIKGKIAEAIAMGVPVVTTSIGSEGYDEAEKVMIVADKPEDFAKAVINLYTDKEKWEELRMNQIQYAKEKLSYSGMLAFWKEIFNLSKGNF